jgi:ssRNA-specific RNase YbeY (16S rRNA maturation enzyme)
MPKTPTELKNATKSITQQSKKQQQSFADLLSWCITHGAISKDVLQ